MENTFVMAAQQGLWRQVTAEEEAEGSAERRGQGSGESRQPRNETGALGRNPKRNRPRARESGIWATVSSDLMGALEGPRERLAGEKVEKTGGSKVKAAGGRLMGSSESEGDSEGRRGRLQIMRKGASMCCGKVCNFGENRRGKRS